MTRKKTFRWLMALLLIGSFSAGCAKLITVRLPDEFKGKKLKEDPPPYQDEGKDPLDQYKEDAEKAGENPKE